LHSNTRGGRKSTRGGRGGGQGRRNRSENDLDKEMTDYMGGVSKLYYQSAIGGKQAKYGIVLFLATTGRLSHEAR
jgi:hypothetical protein